MEQVCEQKVVCEYSSLQLTMFGLDFFVVVLSFTNSQTRFLCCSQSAELVFRTILDIHVYAAPAEQFVFITFWFELPFLPPGLFLSTRTDVF